MREVSLHDAQTNLSSLVEHTAQGESTVTSTDGLPQAVIVGIEEWNRFRAVLSSGCSPTSSGIKGSDILARNEVPISCHLC